MNILCPKLANIYRAREMGARGQSTTDWKPAKRVVATDVMAEGKETWKK